jgi:hypothetical protein
LLLWKKRAFPEVLEKIVTKIPNIPISSKSWQNKFGNGYRDVVRLFGTASHDSLSLKSSFVLML